MKLFVKLSHTSHAVKHSPPKNHFRPPYFFAKQNRPPFFTLGIIMISTQILSYISYISWNKCTKWVENTWKKYEINLKSIFFLFPCIIFKVSCQLRGSEMLFCNITPYQWCVYWLLGLSEDLREGLKIGYIDSLHLQSIQFRLPYKVWIAQRFLTLWTGPSLSVYLL